MKVMRKIIEIDEELCDGCGNCIPSCAEGALELIDGKVRVVADKYCDGLGVCLGECPVGALQVVEREAEDYDEEAVEELLAHKQNEPTEAPAPQTACGCPSAHIQNLRPAEAESAAPAASSPEQASALSHWPVQIMLVPPTAPFLKGADLLVLADCVPVAYPNLHERFLKGKVVMMGCPKLDDAQHYIEKFAQVCKQSGVKSITCVVMEVPCCSGLPVIVKKGMEMSGVEIPFDEVIISTRGKILDRRTIIAA